MEILIFLLTKSLKDLETFKNRKPYEVIPAVIRGEERRCLQVCFLYLKESISLLGNHLCSQEPVAARQY